MAGCSFDWLAITDGKRSAAGVFISNPLSLAFLVLDLFLFQRVTYAFLISFLQRDS